METIDFLRSKRQEWEETHSLRSLKRPNGIDFCSNDYLGLSENADIKNNFIEKVKTVNLGSTSSRLLRGHSENIEILEFQLAGFSNMESTLFFPSGYQANLGLFSSLLKWDAVVFSDELIHASIIDGIKLSGAEKYIWPHNDLNVLEMLLKQKVDPRRMNFVVVESIYSMKGDFAPLAELADLCQRYGVQLIVDEAHATGLFGDHGGGLVSSLNLDEQVFAKIHTAGKALGVSGAWVAGSKLMTEHLVNTSRPFIYSTAPALYQQLALECSLVYLEENYLTLNQKFKQQLFLFQSQVENLGKRYSFAVSGKDGPITSLVCGTNLKALALMDLLASYGFDVRAVRPPSVPKGESLLRMTSPLNRTELEVEKFLNDLEKSLETIK